MSAATMNEMERIRRDRESAVDQAAYWRERALDAEGREQALAAQVERLNGVLFDTFAAIEDGDDDAIPYDAYRSAYNEKPATSLARLKAQWQAEALEDLAQANSRELIHPQIVMDRASELRRQAEESTNGHH